MTHRLTQHTIEAEVAKSVVVPIANLTQVQRQVFDADVVAT